MHTLEKRVDVPSLSDLDVSLHNSKFLRYFDDKPDALFVEQDRVDPVARVLLERDLQDAYDAQFRRVAGVLPSRRIQYDEPGLALTDYCRTHALPVLYEDQTPSPKIHSGVFMNLEQDLQRVVLWATDDARDHVRARPKKNVWRKYAGLLGVNLLATGALLFAAHLYVVNTYLSVRYEDGKPTLHPQMEDVAYVIERRTRDSVRSEMDSYLGTHEDGNGIQVSPRVRPFVDAIKQELLSSTREELSHYFSVREQHGHQRLHPELEPLLEYMDEHLEEFMDEYRRENPDLFPSREQQRENIRAAVLTAIEDPEMRDALRRAILGR